MIQGISYVDSESSVLDKFTKIGFEEPEKLIFHLVPGRERSKLGEAIVWEEDIAALQTKLRDFYHKK